MKVRGCISLIILLFLSLEAFAISFSEKKAFYSVHGLSVAQLRADMDRGHPLSAGKHFDADTQWQVKWQFEYEGDDKFCHLSRATINAAITYHLPRWEDYASGSPALQAKWDAYMQHLQTHENGHAANGEKAAKQIESLFKMLPPMETCQILETMANAKAQQIISEHNAWDIEYDKETQHGVTQGAIFP